jgi:hypothetical protein
MNIHILPTYKASRLQKTKYGNLFLVNKFKSYDNCTPQHIYITNDDKIKEGDKDFYIIANDRDKTWINRIEKVIECKIDPKHGKVLILSSGFIYIDEGCKIILTTDQDLIKDGIQEIDKTFLEWVVKNPSCESVDVKDFPTTEKYNSKGEYIHNSNWIYKIIIPKEEPKQEWNPTQGEEVWMKVFSNWLKGTYIGYDVVKQTHIVREEEKGGGHLFSSIEVLPYYAMPNEPQQETLEQSYQRGYERGLNALIPLIENLNKEITELKRNLYIR